MGNSNFTVPLEIAAAIIDILAAADGGRNLPYVKICALACHAFLPLCRKYIFYHVSIISCHTHLPPTAGTSFVNRLQQSPEIADHIRILEIYVQQSGYTLPFLIDCLEKIKFLESLTISPGVKGRPFETIDWMEMPLRPAFQHLFRLPTLVHLQLGRRICNFSLYDLMLCQSLKKLTIELLEIDGSCNIGEPESCDHDNVSTWPLISNPIRLEEFHQKIRNVDEIRTILLGKTPDGVPVLDFTTLKKISARIRRVEVAEVLRQVFTQAQNLVHVHIDAFGSYAKFMDLHELLGKSTKTVKHLSVMMKYFDDYRDPVSALLTGLEKMAGKNVIQELRVSIILSDATYSTAESWGLLDDLLARDGGWPLLRAVHLDVMAMHNGWEMSEFEKDLMRNLRRSKFTRLRLCKGVKFSLECGDGYDSSSSNADG